MRKNPRFASRQAIIDGNEELQERKSDELIKVAERRTGANQVKEEEVN